MTTFRRRLPIMRSALTRSVALAAVVFAVVAIFTCPDAAAQDHPLAGDQVEGQSELPLPPITSAPQQFSQNVFLPPHTSNRDADIISNQRLQLGDLFSAETASDKLAIQQIGLEVAEDERDLRLYNVQYPLEETIGESQPERAEEAAVAPQRSWSPVFLNEDSFWGRAMDRTGLNWSDRQFSFAVVPQSDDNFGLSTYTLKATAAPQNAPFLRITPRFTWHSLNGPYVPEVTSNLYETDLTTTVFIPAGERWSFMGTVAPGIYSDFDNVTSNAWRIVGRGLGFFQWSSTVKLMAGVTYLDRQDIKLLPAIGVVYTPDSDHKYDLSFPRPRMSVRFLNDGVRERWWYIGADLGGGSWAVRRESGANDILTYRDYRLLVGWEHKESGIFKFRMEAGYAFNRSIEYSSNQLRIDQPGSGVVQLGFDF